jgi:putative CocE/NonD family hydrolase
VSWVSRLLGARLGLPPAETPPVVVERDLRVPMHDGVVLLADRYHALTGGSRPTVLVRSPYGRRGIYGLLNGRLFAERGFQVVVQSCRGTFGSGGRFEPFRHERLDGRSTLDWLRGQHWFDGRLAMHGGSYLGFVQWAIAEAAVPELKAFSTSMTSAEFRSVTYPGDSFWLESALTWAASVETQERSPLGVAAGILLPSSKLRAAFDSLPVGEADWVALGKELPHWEDWVRHDQPGDSWWAPTDFSARVGEVIAPNHLIGGWYDIFLPQTIRDHAALVAAGRDPYLTIGPWAHTDPAISRTALPEALAWFRAHLLGERGRLRQSPVRVFVLGAGEWRDLSSWPPPEVRPRRWHLQPSGGLAAAPPAESGADHYRYDPADPTPNLGGAGMGRITGPRDNRKLEARPDVLCYSTAPLERDLEVMGPVSVELFVRSSLEHTDFFARLCDVDPRGRSLNVTDALVRIRPGRPSPERDGTLRLAFELWPTACRFRRGHRLRLQVSSGAHPRWVRNPGSGEPLATATSLRVAEQAVHHDPAHPSALILSVTTA